MLFTADLRAFSQRLVEKVEEVEMKVAKKVVKKEAATKTILNEELKIEEVKLEEGIKRGLEDLEGLAEEADMMSRVKRRRRARA